MRDQSRMIKGARSWYEHYNSQLEGIEISIKKKISAEGAPPSKTKAIKSKSREFPDSPF